MFFEKKLPKNLEGIENSCTFASAFAQKKSVRRQKELPEQREKDKFIWISES